MDVKRFLAALAVAGALAGPLAGCGENTDVQRGETNCDEQGQEAANPQDASCEETGNSSGGGYP